MSYLYRITVDGITRDYQLTLSHLQGIYTYRLILPDPHPGVEMVRLSPAKTRTLYDIPNYRAPMMYPLNYAAGSHPGEMSKPKGLSIRILGVTMMRYNTRYMGIETANLSEFISGFLTIQLILERSQNLHRFGIFSSVDNDYIPLSLLNGFPLMSLPIEIVSIIMSYNPKTWFRVDRKLDAMSKSKPQTVCK